MKKFYLFAAGMMVAMSMTLSSCNDKKKEASLGGEEYEGQKVEDALLTPEQSKDRLMAVAKMVTGKFNTADQKAAINLADQLYEKYQNYDMNAFEDYYEQRYESFFEMPRYVKAVLAGAKTPASLDQTYLFGFVGESAIFEANERARAWEYRGKSNDNSLIMRCTDMGGTKCEAKMWGEGATHRYEYSWEASHWVTPKIYTSASNIVSMYGSGEYDGDWRSFYKDANGWYYIDWYDNDRKVYVSESDIEYIYGYDANYIDYTYNKQTQEWFYYDYENRYKVEDGLRTVQVDLPDKIFFTLKQGDTELIRVEFSQELVKHNHAYLTIYARVANLSWTADVKVNSTSASTAYMFKYGEETLLSVAASVPSYKLIDKADSQSYEEWIEQYEDRYDELLKQVGGIDAVVDIYGWVQLKAKIDNFGYLYRDIKKLDNGGYHTTDRADAESLVESINSHVKTGLYYGSDIKQASVVAKLARETENSPYSGDYYQESYEYYAEGVLYFQEDGTTYAFDEYFNRKPFTDLEYTLEDIANKYIKLSKYLYDEVGTVSFSDR